MYVVLRSNVDDRKKSILAHPLAAPDISIFVAGDAEATLLSLLNRYVSRLLRKPLPSPPV